MAFTVPTFTKLKIVEQIYLEIFCTEFFPDRSGKVKVRVLIYVRPVIIEWLPIFSFLWKYFFFDDLKKKLPLESIMNIGQIVQLLVLRHR